MSANEHLDPLLRDILNGWVAASLPRPEPPPALVREMCSYCGGLGVYPTPRGNLQCPNCGGKGYIITEGTV